jgi:hypothetical protein
MSEYVFVYKCRKCGALSDGAVTGNESVATNTLIELITTGRSRTIGASVNLASIHSCKDGGFGISDLQGFEERKSQ